MARLTPKRIARPGMDEYGRGPLHYAALEGDLGKVQELLANGSDPNMQDDQGWTPLHVAAQTYSPLVTEALLKAGAKTELRDSFGNTPLFRAVFNSKGDGSVISLLRGAGADVHSTNIRGVSPFILAHRIGSSNVAQFFADVETP